MMAEFGCRPVSWQWCKLVCRYWNRLVSQKKYGYLRDAFLSDLALACAAGSGPARCRAWSSDVICMLSQCDPLTNDPKRACPGRGFRTYNPHYLGCYSPPHLEPDL